ncbi:hypothetical protein KDA_33480 [Dictyobacter alpinus]|uniref:Uncharacterized protein n=1 Tax=Dictyobacter alpinus TaxID=2014873 RepID=A0A402B914_9CHLR|nr:hypothetical protein [Dictyobacter alpinus]GCE27864.1 hypothetical protein KDA_33480 [Dictyobacter alpinus]
MKKKVLKQLKRAIIGSVFIFFIGLNLIIVQTHAHATLFAPTTIATSTLAIMDPTPTDTPTPVPPTDTPVPPTATPVPPTATPVPPTAVPTQKPVPTQVPTVIPPTVPVQPTAPPVDAGTGGNVIPTVTPTQKASATPKPTATPTPEAGVTPTATPAIGGGHVADPATTQGSGMSGALVPLAIGGTVFLLLIVGLISFMFLRKPKSQPRAYSRFPRATAGGAAWLNRPDPNASFALPGAEPQQAAFASPMQMNMAQTVGPAIAMPTSTHKMTPPTPLPPPMFTGPQQAITPTPPPPMVTGPQQAIASAAAEPGYMPSDLRPITSALPQQVTAATQKNPISTSDMSPLPLDNFDLSQILPERKGNNGIQRDASGKERETPISFSPLVAPNVQDDPVLETIMRQAQMGLYALPDQSSEGTNNTPDDSFLS